MKECAPCFHALAASKIAARRWATRVDVYSCLLHAKEYFKSHGTEQGAVQNAARFVGISRPHFVKLFTETYQESPSEFIKRSRLEKARDAILLGASVTFAAELAGYSDPGAFCRAFKKHFSATPSEYGELKNRQSASA